MKKALTAVVTSLFVTSVYAAEAPKQPGPPNIPPKQEAAKKAPEKKEEKKSEAKKAPEKKEDKKAEPAKK